MTDLEVAPPGSGSIVRLAAGQLEVELIPELGARLHRLRYGGVDLLRTPTSIDDHRAEPFFWGSPVMAPWCNRVLPGPTPVLGRVVDLAPNFSDGTAIHGLVAARTWAIAESAPTMATVATEVTAAGWPWRCWIELEVAVETDAVALSLTVANRDTSAMPAGAGFHPWFLRPLEVRSVAAASVSNLGAGNAFRPVDGATDLRARHVLPDGLDDTWAVDGATAVTLWRADAGGTRGITLDWQARVHAHDDPVGRPAYLAIASPAGSSAVAVEVQTHAPEGLRRLLAGEPGGLDVIEPGGSLRLVSRLAVSEAS